MKTIKILLSSLLCGSFVLAGCKNKEEPKEEEQPKVRELTDFIYYLNADKASYSVYYSGDRDATEVVVPEKYDELDVTKVAAGSFAGMKKLESVKFSAKIKTVEDGVFVDNEALSSVKVGETEVKVVSINEEAITNSSVSFGSKNFKGSLFPSLTFGGYNEMGDINVAIDGDPEGIFDKVEYSFQMNEANPYKVEGSFEVAEAPKAIEVGAHGIYRINKITVKSGEEEFGEASPRVTVYTHEYNLALLTATYPTTIFTLKAPTITNNGKIPTYVLLERYAAYNWDNLQWNIRKLPNISSEDATHASNSRFFGNAGDWMRDYIADLYEAYPHSKFHFFFTDLSVDFFYYSVVAQGLPEENYNFVMLSDGSGTAAILNRTYGELGDPSPSGKHAQMMTKLTAIKESLFANGWDKEVVKTLVDFNGSKADYDGKPGFVFGNNAFATLCLFDNCEYWVNRLRAGENLTAINAKDPSFVTKITSEPGMVGNIYANSLLAGLSETDQAKFKALFHFDSDSFDESRAHNKKIMVILGTSWSGERETLYGLMKATMLYYGDEYDYYYKPHPGWPTSTCPDRNDIFDALREEGFVFEELDGAVAAEIIMYFNNDIYLAGYTSTTYASLDDHNIGMGACDWVSPQAGGTYEYPVYMYTYMAIATEAEKTAYGIPAADKNTYVVHVNASDDAVDPIKELYAQYDTALIDISTGEVTYYKAGSPVVLA